MISDISGKMMPQKQTIKTPANNKAASRKSASRENIEEEPRDASDLKSFQRWISRPNEVIIVTPMKAKNIGPMALWEKACTEESTPERVRKVPKITKI
jgi:hypothetical protein